MSGDSTVSELTQWAHNCGMGELRVKRTMGERAFGAAEWVAWNDGATGYGDTVLEALQDLQSEVQKAKAEDEEEDES